MSKGRILIVDPDFDIRNMLKIYFTGQGYEVMIAEDGAGVVALMSPDNIPDVMLIEENLPDMKGLNWFKNYDSLNTWIRCHQFFI